MSSGNLIMSPDSMKELQHTAQKIKEKVYTFTIVWHELSMLFLHISVHQSMPQNGLRFIENFRQHFCVDGTMLSIFFAFTLRLKEDSFERIRTIPCLIKELVVERAKHVDENIPWLSNDHYIESYTSSMKRATNLITSLAALLPAQSHSPANVLPLHIIPLSPVATNSVNWDMTLLSHITPTLSVSETPYADFTSSMSIAVCKVICVSAAIFHDNLSTSPGAGVDSPEMHTLVKWQPYLFHSGMRTSLLAGIKARNNSRNEGDDQGVMKTLAFTLTEVVITTRVINCIRQEEMCVHFLEV
ncbi:hypothetical protein ARMGADRAFT_1089879 [Armillaria gallica]|uniref:Uncharacterized protein n=1 Tax=Armillaria gallica TaxID=47427 RepID=A0A2H3CIR1_ARMGA|nr:hypothetical protein ARMGADRAFT_1089879 [Armillaria gallica]